MDTRPPPNKNRLPLYIGLGAASVVGYYLYSAGGNTKLAKTDAERATFQFLSTVVMVLTIIHQVMLPVYHRQ